MGFASGRYEGASIMLLGMDGSNEVESGGQAGGQGYYTWSITWDPNGFTGNGWQAGYLNCAGKDDAYINENGPLIAQMLKAQGNTCATYEYKNS